MRYARSWQFVFDSPHWVGNLALPVLCGFIPVFGPLVMLGYYYAVVEALHLSRGQRYEDFTFGDTGRKLSAVWRCLRPRMIQSIGST